MQRRGFLRGLFAGSVATALPAALPPPAVDKTADQIEAELMTAMLEQLKTMGPGTIGSNMVAVSHWSSHGGNWSA